jgi:hypothetical protein
MKVGAPLRDNLHGFFIFARTLREDIILMKKEGNGDVNDETNGNHVNHGAAAERDNDAVLGGF